MVDISCTWVSCWSALHCGTGVVGKKVFNFQLSRKKPNFCFSDGQLPFPCWLLVWPSCPVLGLPTNPCLRQSLPWLEDSLPPLPWTLDFNSLLRWFEEENNHQSLVFPGATDHPEGPGYGSGLNDVHGQQSRIAPHRLLGELLLLGQLNCRRWLLFLRASCQRRLHGSSSRWLP